MTLETFALAVLLMWATAEAIYGTTLWASRRRARHHARVERSRAHFAEQRTRLMALAREGQIDTKSITFRWLYALQTSIMRRPDQYRLIAEAITTALVINAASRPTGVTEAVREESACWSSEVRDVFERSGRGLFMLVFDYSLPFRCASTFEKKVDALAKSIHLARATVRGIERVTAWTGRLDDVSRKLVDGGETMLRLA